MHIILRIKSDLFSLSVRLSSDMDPVVCTKQPIGHGSSYAIQNIRYILQVVTDAVAMRHVIVQLTFIHVALKCRIFEIFVTFVYMNWQD